MSEERKNTTLKRIDVKLLNDDAEVFEEFKKTLEEKTGFSGLTNTAVIKWLINNNTLVE
jgi:hypothetical protein